MSVTVQYVILATILIISCLAVVVGSVLYFYRDPDRKVIKIDNAVLSPADGTVISLRRYRAGVAPIISKDGRCFRVDELANTAVLGSDGTIISIHISPLDIHTIRSPAYAKVVYISRIGGGLKLMRDPTFETTNERVSIVLETAYGVIGIVVVGAPIASSVKTLVDVGSHVQAGERIARIRLGSLANLIIPDACGLKPTISCGRRVLAGLTVVAGQAISLAEECYTPKGSTAMERLYLSFLAAYTLVKKLGH
ncbi:MAG: phosphatidylserine decarboxylase [Nitrososphaerota archaeon]